MVEKAQSVMPLNKSSILNPTTYDLEYTIYPKLEGVKGAKAGTTGQKSEGVGETSKLKDADAGGGISKEGSGKVNNPEAHNVVNYTKLKEQYGVAELGIDYTMSRSNSKNPAYRILYSNAGMIYGTYDHYETNLSIKTWRFFMASFIE